MSVSELLGGEFCQQLLGAQRYEAPLLHLLQKVLRSFHQILSGLLQTRANCILAAFVRHRHPPPVRLLCYKLSCHHNMKFHMTRAVPPDMTAWL